MNARKAGIFVFLLLGAGMTARAITPRLNLFAEWGYSQGLFYRHQYNILTSEGNRLVEKNAGTLFTPNGDLMGGVTVKVARRNGLSLMCGYSGVGDDTRVVPIVFRYSFFYNGHDSDGLFNFADGGIGFNLATELDQSAIWMAGCGVGYRFSLAPDISIDFLLNLKSTFDKPKIPDPEGQGFVHKDRILSNAASYYALNLSVAISF